MRICTVTVFCHNILEIRFNVHVKVMIKIISIFMKCWYMNSEFWLAVVGGRDHGPDCDWPLHVRVLCQGRSQCHSSKVRPNLSSQSVIIFLVYFLSYSRVQRLIDIIRNNVSWTHENWSLYSIWFKCTCRCINIFFMTSITGNWKCMSFYSLCKILSFALQSHGCSWPTESDNHKFPVRPVFDVNSSQLPGRRKTRFSQHQLQTRAIHWKIRLQRGKEIS